MIKAIISDFSRVILFPSDESYQGSLNDLNRSLMKQYQGGYDFWKYFKINSQLLDFYKEIASYFYVYIFTSDTIQDTPEVHQIIDPIFKQIFSAKKLNLNKKQSSSYSSLARQIQIQPTEIIYIDDQSSNLAAAKEAGMTTLLFQNNQKLEKEIRSVIQII